MSRLFKKMLFEKSRFFHIETITVILFLTMLLSPDLVFTGAADGLLLWFNIIFPTLFPFMFITALLLKNGGLDFITNILGKSVGKLFRTSAPGTFAVIAGFLCGYPMGAKVTADLTNSKKIDSSEAAYLLSFCNNTSPIFIINFIVSKILKDSRFLAPSLVILILIPLLLSLFFRKIYSRHDHFQNNYPQRTKKQTDSFSFHIFDDCIMDSFENIVKVGGYIIIFSVFIRLLAEFATDVPMLLAILPILELTNGIIILSEQFEIAVSYPLIIALTSFGGICALAQTRSMIHNSGIPFFPYIIQKIVTAIISAITAYGYIKLFH